MPFCICICASVSKDYPYVANLCFNPFTCTPYFQNSLRFLVARIGTILFDFPFQIFRTTRFRWQGTVSDWRHLVFFILRLRRCYGCSRGAGSRAATAVPPGGQHWAFQRLHFRKNGNAVLWFFVLLLTVKFPEIFLFARAGFVSKFNWFKWKSVLCAQSKTEN